jgi:hypothetical protein
MAKKRTRRNVVKLKKNEKRTFVLSVGDEGAILIRMKDDILEHRQFISSASTPELEKNLSEYPKAKVYILVDVLDQAYVQHMLPPVSALNIGKLVQRRLEKDFGDQDIKAARSLGREKEGRKDWKYLFVSLNNSPPFSDWLDALMEMENPFGGIYLLPIEAETYIKKIANANPKKDGKKGSVKPWQILVSHNRVGGFRQIVFKDGKVLFTRIAQPIGGLAPDVIAGNIEQETLNTVEYIRRLGFDKPEELDAYIVCSEDVKNSLEITSFEANSITILTPFEVANTLGLPNASEETDRFGDVVMAASFVNNPRKNLRLETPYTRKLSQLVMAHRAIFVVLLLIAPIMLFLSAASVSDIFDVKKQVQEAVNKQEVAKQSLEDIKLLVNALPEEGEKAVDMVKVNERLTSEKTLPLKFISEFALVKPPDVDVEKVSIVVNEKLDSQNSITAVFNTFFLSSPSDIDRLLEDIDLFTEAIYRQFRTYNVKISGLPGEQKKGFELDFDGKKDEQKKEKTPLEITIKGPRGGDKT